MVYIVYVLRCGDGTLYTGITNDLNQRLVRHRAGTAAKYTRGRGPLKLVFQQRVRSKSAALIRERQIKKLSRRQKLLLIRQP